MLKDSPCKAALHWKQGTPEWLAFRKNHISATDAAPIMGLSPWKTAKQLFQEKLSNEDENIVTPAMQRGIDLEPLARDHFMYATGIGLIDKDEPGNVLIHPEYDWMMASYDGVSTCGEITIEIKCPSSKGLDYRLAKDKKISEYYYPQIQHQIAVRNPRIHYYVVFDGFECIIFEVKRDQEFIDYMIDEEKQFYAAMKNAKMSL